MKQLTLCVFMIFGVAFSFAQTSPRLTNSIAPNGDLVVTWPVQIIVGGTTNLAASYQLEFSTELNKWTPQPGMISGTNFPSRVANIRVKNFADHPVTFFRVGAVFDFTGGNFIKKVIRNAPLANSLFGGANFFLARLDGCAFDNADLSGADFRLATMTHVRATNADFTLSRLADADLTSADFRGSKLILTEVSGAKLTFADLSGADLRGAVFEDNDSNFTRFHNTLVDETTIFDARVQAIWRIVNNEGAGRTFRDVDLSFADLSGGNLTNATLAGIDVSGVDFSGADLSGANLTNATLRLLDLRGTKIDDSTNITNKWRTIWDIINNPRTNRLHMGADLSLGLWVDATLEGADIRNSDFTSGVVFTTSFKNANAIGARFTNVEFHGASFENADLRSVNFAGASLQDVTFLGAKTNATTFVGATFLNTTMPDGRVVP